MNPSKVTPAPVIEYLVSMPQPWTHIFQVTMKVSGLSSGEANLLMPVWTPGSYLVREFARNVQGFSAKDQAARRLSWAKSGKNRWTVRTEGATTLEVSYQVYAFEPSVRTSFLCDAYGTINGAGLFMFVEGLIDCAHILRVNPFPSWDQITTGLDALEGEANAFRARDYDNLVDCPVMIGNHRLLRFETKSIPHRIALRGHGNEDPEKLCTDLQKIAECAAEIMGEIPCAHYTFMIHLTSDSGGGLEHSNSALLHVNRWGFKPEENYRRFLSLAAHEYFHLWNVKRMRPSELGPFDYSRENHTRLLWVAEGFTDYYADLILRHAGLLTPEEYLEAVSKNIRDLMEVPGRHVESVSEASYDAWIKFYRPDADSPNRSVSYYLKGGLIGLMLDLELRNRAQGKSLDEVFKLLYSEFFGRLDRGFTEAEFREACERVAEGTLDKFFDEYCYGTAELDLERYLGYAGLRFKEPVETDKDAVKGYLGISAKTSDGKLMVVGVTRGSPAYEHGLSVNDEIIAADGFRMNQELLTARISEAAPGSKIEFLVARDGCLVGVPVELGARDQRDYKIGRRPDSTAQQKRVYEEWLHAKWEESPEIKDSVSG